MVSRMMNFRASFSPSSMSTTTVALVRKNIARLHKYCWRNIQRRRIRKVDSVAAVVVVRIVLHQLHAVVTTRIKIVRHPPPIVRHHTHPHRQQIRMTISRHCMTSISSLPVITMIVIMTRCYHSLNLRTSLPKISFSPHSYRGDKKRDKRSND